MSSETVPLSSLVLVNEVVRVRASPLSSPVVFPARTVQFVVSSPSTQPIAIDRIFSRIHLHNSAMGVTETVLAIVRASDQALMGGVIADIDENVPMTQAERDFVYETGSQFILHPTDAIVVQAFRFVRDTDMNLTDNNQLSVFGIFAAMAYHEVDLTPPLVMPPKFVQLEALPMEDSTRRVLALKDDGSVWRTENARATPVVWIQV